MAVGKVLRVTIDFFKNNVFQYHIEQKAFIEASRINIHIGEKVCCCCYIRMFFSLIFLERVCIQYKNAVFSSLHGFSLNFYRKEDQINTVYVR